VPLDGTIKFRR